MPITVLLCTDGSERSTQALASGWALLGPDVVPVVVTVADTPDPTLLSGSGFGGPVVTPEEFDEEAALATDHAHSIVAATADRLGLIGADLGSSTATRPKPSANWPPTWPPRPSWWAPVAWAVSSGPFLGSVSDHVLRHAPCTVLVTGEPRGDEAD